MASPIRTTAAGPAGQVQAVADVLIEDYVEHRATRLRESRRRPGPPPPRCRRRRPLPRASEAAERIAWTPYSRKAMATAEARAQQRGSTRIDCADLLVRLARLGRGTAATVLIESGTVPTILGTEPPETS
ncbi:MULTISPECIES: hypothetical protein [unclassified Streptomyces]|uniref:hypothetical protein n=1 Tax=unclassified Streptomyces TaxID=2593676 RepID=UPI0036FADCF4